MLLFFLVGFPSRRLLTRPKPTRRYNVVAKLSPHGSGMSFRCLFCLLLFLSLLWVNLGNLENFGQEVELATVLVASIGGVDGKHWLRHAIESATTPHHPSPGLFWIRKLQLHIVNASSLLTILSPGPPHRCQAAPGRPLVCYRPVRHLQAGQVWRQIHRHPDPR